ncbi:MAG TPA: DUF167 domain-containing protein [Candidatus Saccharimonadales bacterium]|nr:DUF167 domain-containing protein [Candidatus Saccharimonadales bacterium]
MKITVKVKPGSKKGPLVQPGLAGDLLVYIKEPALEGKANVSLVKILAEYYNVSKSRVVILKGKTSTTKIVEILL